jgi:2-amino-4-hydroxy-6-hydroxymethyldihydropteridine diphosphokinase
MSIAYIGIGSNLGKRELNCFQTIELIKSSLGIVEACSSIYETKAWGVVEQSDFINMAIKLITSYEPLTLLHRLKGIEKTMGREKTFRWGPRVIDLDILFYDNLTVVTPELIIPHPGLHERLFVLKPMMEIAPYVIHPGLNKTIQQLYEEALCHEAYSL